MAATMNTNVQEKTMPKSGEDPAVNAAGQNDITADQDGAASGSSSTPADSTPPPLGGDSSPAPGGTISGINAEAVAARIAEIGGRVGALKEASAERETSPMSDGSSEGISDIKAKKMKKKEDKSIEHILKALNSLDTPEEKLAALCKKYADLHEDHRLLQTKFKQSQKKLTQIMREKDQLQTEHSKAVLAKSKLESLCRELQRHNKLVKEESLARAREEEEKRKEVTNKFQTTINDIQQQMNEHYAKNTKLREENMELANKLKGLIEQYELREQHIEKVFKHKDLEQQLVDAKLAQANLQMTEEKERSLKEKQILIKDATEAHKKIQLLEEQEKQLRAQVALYTEKYEEFQQTLAKSNEVFGSFRTEMDKMTKKIKKLEKETTMWRTRWENSNKALLDMVEEKTRSDKEINTLNSKIQKLESLCRALQQDRKKQSNEDRDASIEKEASPGPDGSRTPPNTPQDSANPSPSKETQPRENGDGEDTTKVSESPTGPQAVDSVASQSEAVTAPESSQSEGATAESSQSEKMALPAADQSESQSEETPPLREENQGEKDTSAKE